MPDLDAYQDAMFPKRGIDHIRAFDAQGSDTTILGTNVRTFEPLTDRARGGQRPGLSKFIPEQLPLSYISGSRVIQNLNFVIVTDSEALLGDIPYGQNPNNPNEDPTNNVTNPSGPGRFYGPPDGYDVDAPDTPAAQRERQLGRGGSSGGPHAGSSQERGGGELRNGGSGDGPKWVIKKTPRIIWEDPADISEGTPLSGTQLNAVAVDPQTGLEVDGTYTYDPPSGTVLDDGENYPLYVEFRPTNVLKYNHASKTVHIDVIPPDDPGGGGAELKNCILIKADVSDLGFDCYAVCPPDSLGSTGTTGATWTQMINDGLCHVIGSVQTTGSGAVECP